MDSEATAKLQEQLFIDWCRGWADGAGRRPIDTKRAEEQPEYLLGYQAGQEAFRVATEQERANRGMPASHTIRLTCSRYVKPGTYI